MSTVFKKKKKYIHAYYMDDLEELSWFDIGSLSYCINSSEWFRNYRIAENRGNKIKEATLFTKTSMIRREKKSIEVKKHR